MDLKKIRKSLDMSQYELAKLSGVSREKITKAECGYRDLTSDETEKIKTAIKGASHGNRNKKKQSK